MTAEVSTIYLLDVATGDSVEAELRDAIEDTDLHDWKSKWQPEIDALREDLERRSVPRNQWPQSLHWNWQRKMDFADGLIGIRGFSVTVQGETQGLALVDLTKSAREPSQLGKALVYLDYLEVAPWNRADLGRAIKLKGVGTALLTAVVALSEVEDFKGRMGLHSLPQSEEFYRQWCGMTDLGPDAAYSGLRYFEMTAEQASSFLK